MALQRQPLPVVVLAKFEALRLSGALWPQVLPWALDLPPPPPPLISPSCCLHPNLLTFYLIHLPFCSFSPWPFAMSLLLLFLALFSLLTPFSCHVSPLLLLLILSTSLNLPTSQCNLLPLLFTSTQRSQRWWRGRSYVTDEALCSSRQKCVRG